MAQNPKPSEVKKTGSWLSGHRSNDNTTDDVIAALKKSIEEKNQTILQREQSISSKDAQLSEKHKSLLEKDEIISKLSNGKFIIRFIPLKIQNIVKIHRIQYRTTTHTVAENDTLKNQVSQLQDKISQLEAELATKQSQPTGSS